MQRRGALLIAFGAVVACSADIDVEVESRSANTAPNTSEPDVPILELEPGSTPVPDPAPAPAPPTTANATPSPATDDALVFELESYDVALRLRETTADTPPTGYNGFGNAIVLPDGTFVATGFDAWTDGLQPEPSALWVSSDADRWERSGLELSEPSGQQTTQALFLNGDTTTVVVSDVAPFTDTDGTTNVEFGLGVTWQAISDRGWGAVDLVGDVAVNGHFIEDGEITLVGARFPNDVGKFSAVTMRADSPGDPWVPQLVDRDANGEPQAGSIVMSGVDLGDISVAVGATTATDNIGAVPSEFLDTVMSNGFTDIAVWRRPGPTAEWSRVTIDGFEGVIGGAIAYDIAVVGDSLFISTRETQAYRQVAALWRSDDQGLTWTPVSFERAVTGNLFDGSSPAHSSVSAVDGFIVFVDEIFTVEGPRSFVTVMDAETGISDTHNVADWSGFHQIAAVLDVNGVGLAFGRVERGPNASDLQVVEIRRIDDAEPPPPSGGGSDA